MIGLDEDPSWAAGCRAGTRRPAGAARRALVKNASRPRRRTMPRLTSRPATTRSSTTATFVYPPTILVAVLSVKSHWYATGHACPSTLGPSRIPAEISPTTSGSPIARAASPSARAPARSTAKDARKTRTSCSLTRERTNETQPPLCCGRFAEALPPPGHARSVALRRAGLLVVRGRRARDARAHARRRERPVEPSVASVYSSSGWRSSLIR